MERARRPVRRSRFNWLGVGFWIFVLGLSVATAWFVLDARTEMAREARDLSFRPVEARMVLSANDGWRELGFILRPGDRVAIWTEGEYLQSAGGKVSGEGVSGSGGEKRGSRSYEPLFPHGCLIARTSGKPSEVFHIGAGGVLETDKGGRLQVRVNDLDLIANEGELAVGAATFLDEAPGGLTLRGCRDSAVTPIKR